MTANLVRWNWQGVSGFVLVPARFFTEDRKRVYFKAAIPSLNVRSLKKLSLTACTLLEDIQLL